MQLDNIEVHVLTNQLYEDLCRSTVRKKGIADNKFKNIQIVLDTLYGLKPSTFMGFERKNSFSSENHVKTLKEINEDHRFLLNSELDDRTIDKLYNSLKVNVKFGRPSPYQALSEIEDEKWNTLSKKYQGLGIKNTSNVELHRIIFDLMTKHGVR